MIDNIFVYDDILPISYQNYLEHNFMGEGMANWMLLDDISYGIAKDQLGIKDSKFGLVHPLKVDHQIKSHLYNLSLPILFYSTDRINFKINDIFQARAFLQFPRAESTPNNQHVDLTFPHLVCLYYLNDCDGETIIYNQSSDEVLEGNVKDTEFTVQKRISPKKGRVVLFDGKYYHSSSNPTVNRRCILNFDIV